MKTGMPIHNTTGLVTKPSEQVPFTRLLLEHLPYALDGLNFKTAKHYARSQKITEDNWLTKQANLKPS